jgi:hypothetical protein
MVDKADIARRLWRYYNLAQGAYTIHDDGTVDVQGNVRLWTAPTNRLMVNFGVVSGTFVCDKSALESLEGAPREVGRDFSCKGNLLTSLQDAPKKVGGSFICSSNRIESLEHGPQTVGKNYYCASNQLKNLQGAPRVVSGVFSCDMNDLESLEGSPDKVGEWFLFTYKSDLPLLRTLVARAAVFAVPNEPAGEVYRILNDKRWMGHGKAKSMMCAAELIRAGFKENARW